MEFLIAQKEDSTELFHLFERVLKDTFKQNQYDDEAKLKSEIDRKQHDIDATFSTDHPKKIFYKVVKDGEIVGAISYGKSNDLINKTTDGKLKDMVEIGSLYILPDHQGQGIASFLIQELFEEMKAEGISEYCLDCIYPIAQQKWTNKFGEPTYHFKDYFGPNHDYMIWVQDL